jgi:hypothetical protein
MRRMSRLNLWKPAVSVCVPLVTTRTPRRKVKPGEVICSVVEEGLVLLLHLGDVSGMSLAGTPRCSKSGRPATQDLGLCPKFMAPSKTVTFSDYGSKSQ